MDLPWSPVTIETDGQPPRIRVVARYLPDTQEGGPKGAVLHAGADASATWSSVAEVVADNSEEFRWRTENGLEFVARATVPADAANGGQFPSLPIDLPVEVIGAIVNGAIVPSDAYVSAATDADGDVHTMVLVTPLGLYARYSKQWIKLTDVSTISHLNVVDVAPDDVNAYDEADTNGEMVNITDLTPVEAAAVEFIEPETTPAAPLTASVPTRAVIVASLDDAPAAIAFAQSDEGRGSRWYVGRRLKALGYDKPLPWEE